MKKMIVNNLFFFSYNAFYPFKEKCYEFLFLLSLNFCHLKRNNRDPAKIFFNISRHTPAFILPSYNRKANFLFNPLPNDKFLDWSKFKAFADNKINATKNHYV